MQKQIEYLSKKTLDLSLRNPQINFKRERLTNIHILKSMQSFYDELVKNEKGITLTQTKETLETGFSPQELYSKTEYLYTKQRQIINEYGFHPLYAVFGLLKWQDESTKKEVLSPLLMVPVEISKKGRKSINLSHNGDQILLNPTLVHRLSLDNIDLSVFDLVEHQAFDINHYLNTIRQTLEEHEGFKVIEESYLGLFSSTHLYIYKDLEENKDKIEQHNLILKLYQKDESLISEQKINPNLIDQLWKETKNYQIFTADGSQETATLASREETSFVLQGPPGTGKSQTITNIIAQAISENKKVLFVAEKKAALDVVYQKLKSKGLDLFTLDLHHYQVKKDHLVKQLVESLKEYETFKYQEDPLFSELENLKAKLEENFVNRYYENEVINESLYDIYGYLLKYLDVPVINYKIDKIYEKTKEELLKDLEDLKKYHTVITETKDLPKSLKEETIEVKIPKEVLIKLYENGKQILQNLSLLKDQYHYKITEPKHLEALEEMINHYKKMPNKLIYDPKINYEEKHIETKNILDNLDKIDPNILALDYDETIETLSLKSFLGIYPKSYKELNKKLIKWFNKGDMTQKELLEEMALLKPYLDLDKSTHKQQELKEKLKEYQWIKKANFRITKKDIEIYQKMDPKELREVSRILTKTKEDLDYYLEMFSQIFIESKKEMINEKNLSLISKLIEYYQETKNLKIFKQVQNKIKEKKLNTLYKEMKEHPVNDWESILLKRYYLEWLGYLEFKYSSPYTKALLELDLNKLRKLENQKLDKNVFRIKQNVFKNYPDLQAPEVKMILSESLKTKGQKSARQIIDAIPEILLEMKPCFLMSPTTVSAFLPSIANMFDLVIFDEASQVVPEHAIGSIYRGKQLIVCGDHEQLPPTQFFSQIIEIDEEEYEEISDYESILDIARTSLLTYQLNWHYRSKHSELIHYSNQQIYKTLITASEPKSISKGIYYHYLKDGYYENQTNRKEAQFIANKVITHAKENPHKSLGVIAFSKKQEKEIDYQIKKLRKAHPEVESFFDEEKEEYFFVKNLENVQGDERDIIYLSICYGKTKEGKMSYRFGPINQQVGYRRLNVAITRAKEQMNLVTSILPEDINDPNKNEGIAFLKNYLYFSLNENKTVDQKDVTKDLVIKDIIETLEERKYSASYDQMLFDSITLENEVTAVCLYLDSSGYKNLPTLKDRNILSLNLIKQKGWKVYQISGISWYENKEEELEKLLKFLEENHIFPEENKKISLPVKEERYEFKVPKEEIVKVKAEHIEDKPEPEKQNIRDVLSNDLNRVTVLNLVRTDDETLVEYIKRFIIEVINVEEGLTEIDLYTRIAPLYDTKKLSIHEKSRIQQWLLMWQEKGYLTFSNGIITK